jgi:hypothetical protein
LRHMGRFHNLIGLTWYGRKTIEWSSDRRAEADVSPCATCSVKHPSPNWRNR